MNIQTDKPSTPTDLKNTSDDAIPNYLNSLKFKQIHALVDTRLVLGYSAFLIAAACFLWDYKLGFESTKYYTAAAVAVYTVLNSVLTFWIGFVEKGTVYQAVGPDGSKVRAAAQPPDVLQHYASSAACCRRTGKDGAYMTCTDLHLDLDQEERAHLSRQDHHHAQGGQAQHHRAGQAL